jgi:hypothetical protein
MATVPIASGASSSSVNAAGARAGSSSAETKTRSSARGLPAFDMTIARLMAILATVMLPGGLIAIGLGWYGAAHTPFVFEQMPYLISGGLLGVGLLVAGGLLYVGSWLARLAELERDEGAKIRDMIRGVRQELELLPGLVGGAAPTAQRSFVATKTGTMFHVPDCSVVAGRNDLRDVSGDESGLTPCKICQPLAQG